jgi:outer membrane receptor protein involved in Fe transport
VPLLALRGAELVSGGQDAEYSGALAGVLTLRTVDPGERWSAALRYSSDGELDTRYDHGSAMVAGPLPVMGLGVAGAVDVTLDDT